MYRTKESMNIGIESLDVSHQSQDQSNKVHTKEARKFILNNFVKHLLKVFHGN